MHSPWGGESIEQLARLAAGERPFFALVHLWDAHTPRSYPAEYEDRRHGRNAYERAVSGMDAWVGAAVEAAGPDTVVVLTGDHGENVVFEPHNLREQAAWRRINQRLPIARWSQATVDRGVRSHSKAAVGAALLLEPRPDAARIARAGAAGRVRAGRLGRRAANAGEPRRPRADPGRLGRRAAPAAGWQGTSLAESLRGGGEPPGHPVMMEIAVAPSIPAIRQQAVRDGRHKLITSFDDDRVTDALYDLAADPGERRNLSLAEPVLAEQLRETLSELASERAEAVAMAADEDEEIAERLRELGYM